MRRPVPTDLAAVGALLRARDRAHAGVAEVTDDEIAHDWATPGFELGRDAWLVEDAGGRPVAYADVLPDAPGTHTVETVAAPGHEALESALLELVATRAAELARQGSAVLHAAIVHGETDRARRYTAAGYRRVRTFHRMRLDPGAPVHEQPWPRGVAPTPFDPAIHPAEVHALLQAAFADHVAVARPGPFDQWRHETLAHPGFAPELWVLAREHGRLVGATVAMREPGRGWIKALGVSRPARGRGIAAAMLAEALRRLRADGLAVVELGVDAESPTGATRLYERAGMRVVRRTDVYELRVGAPPAPGGTPA